MVKVNSKSQKGRSMVEMLGVLAIMGVLSVGGVYGYGVAMKKHKANELLHQASMLATTISAQAMTNDGKLPETITNFGSTSNGTFETTVGESADKTQFILTITGLDDGVCEQLKNLQGGMMREAICTGTTATLSYYKNLATTEEEGKNSPTGGSSESVDPLCKDVTCGDGEECVGGNCIKSKTTDGSCAKNSDCNTWCASNKGADDYGCYCRISATLNWNSDRSDCSYSGFRGTCQTISNTEKTNKYSSSDNFTWLSAKNFCSSIGSHMVKTTDVCGSTANPFDYPSGCTGTPVCYWLQECWCDKDSDSSCTCNDNSCRAFLVSLGDVNDNYRDYGYYAYALCE